MILPDGTVETKSISSISGAVITVSSAFSQTPNVNTVWLLQDDTVQAQKFRVITVEESDGINYAITALSYVNEKYAFIEDGATLPTRTVSILNLPKDPPIALQAEEKIVEINNQAVSKLIVSWQPIVGVTQYQVNYRFNNGNFVLQQFLLLTLRYSILILERMNFKYLVIMLRYRQVRIVTGKQSYHY